MLGVSGALEAVRATAAGDVDQRHLDAVGDDWDVEARATAALAEAGLPHDALDRHVGDLSGGEAMLAAIVGVRLRAHPIALLDEPTNNLDRDARARVYDLVRTWRGTLIVVSHDTQLLELTRAAMGRRAAIEKCEPKIIMGGKKRAAQVSAGRLRVEASGKEAAARAALDVAERRMRDDESVHIDLPDPGFAAGRRIATIGDDERSWVIQGPERVALIGPNGAGKTTLLERLVAGAAGAAAAGAAAGATGSPAEGESPASGVPKAGRIDSSGPDDTPTGRFSLLSARAEALSRRTTSTSTRSTRWSRRSPPTAVPCSSSVTTTAFCVGSCPISCSSCGRGR